MSDLCAGESREHAGGDWPGTRFQPGSGEPRAGTESGVTELSVQASSEGMGPDTLIKAQTDRSVALVAFRSTGSAVHRPGATALFSYTSAKN